jgi:signal transduction protein with GAF and PtsI domain
MRNIQLNYETLINVTKSLSRSKDPDEIIVKTVESIQMALGVKGCALFLINHETKELEVASSTGLSDEYLNKGTVSALKSIADSLKEGPVAVFDVGDDPRIQYPEAAHKEGISSILSVPVLWAMMSSAPCGSIPRISGISHWTTLTLSKLWPKSPVSSLK